MKHVATVVTLGLGAILWAGVARAAEEHQHGQHGAATQVAQPQAQVLEGRLIDLGCYAMGMAGGGGKHATCAVQCARKGLPVGLLDSATSKVYTVVLPSPGLAPHMEKTVRITGKLHAEHLLSPDRMEVKDGDAWKAVELPAVM
ncbi:MAG: hypothetical protein AB1505_18205 [Candidatus Latescibacterota bacterium]